MLQGGPERRLDVDEVLAGAREACRTPTVRGAVEAVTRLPHETGPVDVPSQLRVSLDPAVTVAVALYAFLSSPLEFAGAVDRACEAVPARAGLLRSLAGSLTGAFAGEARIPSRWTDGVAADRARDLADRLATRGPRRRRVRAHPLS